MMVLAAGMFVAQLWADIPKYPNGPAMQTRATGDSSVYLPSLPGSEPFPPPRPSPTAGLQPTPQPTLTHKPAPPSAPYQNCIVTAFGHGYGDERIVATERTTYNASGVPELYTIEDGDGRVNHKVVVDYEAGWRPNARFVYRGDPLTLAEVVRYRYLPRVVHRYVDENADGRLDYTEVDQFDHAGRPVRMQLRDSVFTYDYDTYGQLQWEKFSLWGATSGFLHIWRDGLVSRVGFDEDNDGEPDVWTLYDYNARGWMIRGSQVGMEITVSYDANGWPVQQELWQDGQYESRVSYDYDSVGRLIVRRYLDHLGESEYTEYENDC